MRCGKRVVARPGGRIAGRRMIGRGMDDWLQIPDRPQGMPRWRLCLMMAVTFLILWVGAPVLFALALHEG